MSAEKIITLTTDFGTGSAYIAQMKAVLLSRAAGAEIVDVTHAISPQNITQAAITLEDTLPWFPAGAVHIGVVDPGVGTDRAILAGRCGEGFFVGPDNGLFSRCPISEVVRLDRPEHWLAEISRTFHGRDIMSPVAAAIAAGVPLRELGTPTERWTMLPLPQPSVTADQITGEIIFVDSFGNLVSNLTAADLRMHRRVAMDDQPVKRVNSYGDAKRGELVALVGSSGRVEIAIAEGNAAERHGRDHQVTLFD